MQKDFDDGTFTGTVTGYDTVSHLNNAILHRVSYEEDNDAEEMSFAEILTCHAAFLSSSCPADPSPTITLPAHPSTPLPLLHPLQANPAPVPTHHLPIPSSFSTYNLRFPMSSGTYVQGTISDHVIDENGLHKWRLLPPSTTQDPPNGIWIDTNTLFTHFKQAQTQCNISQPTKMTPIIQPLKDFDPVKANSNWTSTHPFVGVVASAHPPLPPLPPDHRGRRQPKPPMYTVTIEAAFPEILPGAPTQFWGRLHHDQTLSVIFSNPQMLADASHSDDVERRARKRTRNRPVHPLISPDNPSILPDVSFDNQHFRDAVKSFHESLPSDPESFFSTGFRIAPQKVPRDVTPLYRRGLRHITKLIAATPSDASLWQALLLYDGFILAPFEKPESFSQAIRRRVALFLSGDWSSLQHQFRDIARPPKPNPISDDPTLHRASNAQTQFSRHHSIGAAANALRAPAPPPSSAPQAHTGAFKALNPQVGSPAPVIPPFPHVHPLPRSTPATRRHAAPPSVDPPAPLVLTTAQVIRKVRRSNPASAGGLSGSNYKTLRSWFFANDPTSDDLTVVLNLIVSGKVPASIVPLLNAGRGIAVPKNDEGALRPIVIGHVLLRLLGSIALSTLTKETKAFFLEPKPLQFGVGVASGCELVAAAISAHLDLHPEHIDCALDSKNAFNSWCRSQMWQPLLDKFPSIYSLVKLMYGDASSVLFHDPGSGLCEIMNSVGCKQGCSLGSFLFSLAIHRSLSQLQEEFSDLLVIAMMFT